MPKPSLTVSSAPFDRNKRIWRKVSGWLIVDKPIGITSSQVVNAVKRILSVKKAGHAGTLDPLATGMLPIALGEATKTIPYIISNNKRYFFQVNWGEQRNTDDLEGEVIKESNLRPSEEQILNTLKDFIGTITQIPPQFSALKINGQRAYKLARQGCDFQLTPREVTIHNLTLLEQDQSNNFSTFDVFCSKGTYVRALARDLGEKLGCFGYVGVLHRKNVDPFEQTTKISLKSLEATKQNLLLSNSTNYEDLDKYLLPLAAALPNWLNFSINNVQAQKIKFGNNIVLTELIKNGKIIAKQNAYVSYQSKMLAMGYIENNIFYPQRVIQD